MVMRMAGEVHGTSEPIGFGGIRIDRGQSDVNIYHLPDNLGRTWLIEWHQFSYVAGQGVIRMREILSFKREYILKWHFMR
jgi:hypothetical protein